MRQAGLASLTCVAALTGCAAAAGALENRLAGKTVTQCPAALREECRAVADVDRGTVKEKKARSATLRQRCAELGAALTRIPAGRPRAGTMAAFQRSYGPCIDESKRHGAMFNYRGQLNRRAYYLHARAVCEAYGRTFEEVTGSRSAGDGVQM